ncbi:MAG: di-trans,poly-cis-decaprenylcistransferase [Clostridia bacterium]|nr:di-trans,poly-cis-decaprenylcistransferase [Clostridia bacterium]
MVDKDKLPRHVGIIMDGNGRWAKQRGLPRTEGHKKGAEVFRDISTYASELGIEYLTFYAFSTENWKRPEQEVSVIMDIFRDFLHEAQDRKAENEEKGFRFRFIGDMSKMADDIKMLATILEADSSDKSHTVINVAANYGGRSEILRATTRIAELVAKGEISSEDITEDMFSSMLYTAEQPDPDLIIRPSGEYRLSNFLTWQSAYSEFWFSDVLWPDFTRDDFDKALNDFANRSRRFGAV